jgi:hypothetical protein
MGPPISKYILVETPRVVTAILDQFHM